MELKTFKEWRKEKGITATFVANKLHISKQALYNKEKQISDFTFTEGIAYCDILNVKPDEVKI